MPPTNPPTKPTAPAPAPTLVTIDPEIYEAAQREIEQLRAETVRLRAEADAAAMASARRPTERRPAGADLADLVVPVRNNASLVSLPLGLAGKGAPPEMLHLPPGMSFVPLATWERAMQHKMVQVMCSSRVTTVSTAPEARDVPIGRPILEARDPVPANAPLPGDEPGAIAALADVLEVGVLRRLLEVEVRPQVVRAIHAQIAHLEAPRRAAAARRAEG